MQKLDKNDYRFIAGCILISIAFCFITAKYFHKAFPEASIDFKITREESRNISDDFLKKANIDFSGFTHCTIFDYNDSAKTFLERELGLDSANKIIGSQVRLWRWNNRYFKPLQKEEFTVEITSKGEIVGFEHLIKEEQSGDSLTELAALQIAEEYLISTIGKQLRELTFLTAKSEKRPNRTDWIFTWKTLDIKNAEYRIEVLLQGNELGAYKEFLQIPQKWTRDYEKLRSLNNTANMIAEIFFLLIIVGMFFVFISKVREKNIKKLVALSFGIITAVLSLLASLNILPISLFSYDTTSSYGSFLGQQILMAVLGALITGAFICFITATSESIYRETYKSKIPFSNLFKWQNIRSKQFFNSTIVGLTMAFTFIGYQVIFYIATQRFGVWSPADVPYSEMLNTKIPALFALLGGFQPAVNEEFIFRVFAIAFCMKLFKSKWAAIIVPALIWGFLHSGYPQQPFYIRGVEVGIAGIFIGIIMLKFDVLAVLIWHYTIDAFYTAFLLLRSHNPYFIISGALAAGIMFIPLIISIVFYIRNKGFLSADELKKGEEIPAEPAPTDKIEYRPIKYTPLSPRKLNIGITIACLFLCTFFMKMEKFGNSITYKISKKEARTKAEEFIKYKGVDLAKYKNITLSEFDFDNYAGKYILEKQGIKGLNDIYGKTIKPVTWHTRFFTPLQEEEYNVYVDTEGEIYTFEHIIAESDSGAELTKDSALIIGTNFISSQGINLDEYEIKEISPEKRKSRLDYNIIWEAKQGIDKAKLRLKLTIQGNEVSKFEKFIKIPEEWERERKKLTGIDISRMGLMVIFFITIIGTFIGLLITRAKQVLWKQVIIISTIFIGLQLINRLNALPLKYQGYITSIGLNVFNTTSIVGIIATIIGVFMFSAICIGLLTALYPDIFNVFRKQNILLFKNDAVMCSIVSLCASLGITQIKDFLTHKFPAFSKVPEISFPQNIDTAIPFISYFTITPIFILLILTGLGALIYSITYYITNPIKKPIKPPYTILILILIIYGLTDGKTFAEITFSFIPLILSIGTVFVLVKWLFRNNLLAYPLSLWIMLFGRDSYILYTKSTYKADAIVLMVIAILPLIYLLFHKKESPIIGENS